MKTPFRTSCPKQEQFHVKRIIPTPNVTTGVSLQGLYFGENSLTEAQGWGLSEKQRQEINRLADENGEFIILFDPRGEGDKELWPMKWATTFLSARQAIAANR